MTEIGNKIKSLRLKHEFKSQKDLALKTGVSPATLSRIESGVQVPNPETLLKLSEFFPSTTFDELMFISGWTPTYGLNHEEIVLWKERAMLAENEVKRLNGLIDTLIMEREGK